MPTVRGVPETHPQTPDLLSEYLEECRTRVTEEIRRLVPGRVRHGSLLYELMLDYPLRHGKALRPALCIAVCRALGGHEEAVLRSAAVLELYHNAFLIHDDVEDGSEKRRREDTLHRRHGVPIAVNVGDGMLALTMEPLLENIELVGLGRALRILKAVARMARESAEGQMMELEWVRNARWAIGDRDYLRMVYKKTCWYTFLTPVIVGAIAAGKNEVEIETLVPFAITLGVAFQIQDDVLNLIGEEVRYGKEIGGDLWEGKHTLMLVHAVRTALPRDGAEAARILAKQRPPQNGHVDPRLCKTDAEVRFLRDLIDRTDGVDYALGFARTRADRARRSFAAVSSRWPASVHRDFLIGLVDFVVKRDW